MKIQETVYFHCTRETLFSYIEDPEKQKLWMKGLLSNESTSPGRKGAGSTFRMVIKEGRKTPSYDGEVTAHDWPSRIEVRIWGGGLPAGMFMRADYRLSEEGGRTRLDYTATAEGKIGFFLRLMFPLFKIFGRMQLRGFLKTLKGLVEAPTREAA